MNETLIDEMKKSSTPLNSTDIQTHTNTFLGLDVLQNLEYSENESTFSEESPLRLNQWSGRIKRLLLGLSESKCTTRSAIN